MLSLSFNFTIAFDFLCILTKEKCISSKASLSGLFLKEFFESSLVDIFLDLRLDS